MRIFSTAAVLSFLGYAASQQVGTLTSETHLPFGFTTCTGHGQCQTQQLSVTLDSNWRWSHNTAGYQNCYTGNTWDSNFCSDEKTCTQNCALEGVSSSDWSSPYGVTTVNGGIQMKFVTQGPYSKNIGGRVYLLDGSGDKYQLFKLKNKEFTFDVDVSNMPCGLNGALYFSEMPADGGKSKYPTNKAGAKYGTGYCDAQCPHDIKWIHGEANSKNWQPSPTDVNAGKGHYGSCCAEMDIWEANKESSAFTAHPCAFSGDLRCEGKDCGDNDLGQRFQGVCDKDGCDINPFRHGVEDFFGPGKKVDTNKPFTVVTQFLTSDNTDNGDLVEIKRFFVQNGQKIEHPMSNLPGIQPHNSIKDSSCAAVKKLFGDINDFQNKGGLKKMGESLERGMVLVMSMWDDHEANMLWLDSDYPLDKSPSTPGIHRGPCSRTSGDPRDVESQFPNSSVKYFNVKVGNIGTTTVFAQFE